MRMLLLGAAWIGLLWTGAPSAGAPEPTTQAYRLSWMGLDVGAAHVALGPHREEGTVTMRLEACSTGLADTLYPVADLFASRARITESGVHPREYSAERQENGDQTQRRIDFHSAPGKALFASPDDAGRKALDLQSRTYDYLSVLLALVKSPPAVGETRELPVISGREVVQLRAEGEASRTRNEMRLRKIRLTRPDDDKTITLWLPIGRGSRSELPHRLHVEADFGTIRAQPAGDMPCSVSRGDTDL